LTTQHVGGHCSCKKMQQENQKRKPKPMQKREGQYFRQHLREKNVQRHFNQTEPFLFLQNWSHFHWNEIRAETPLEELDAF
jgi:hypothetical protein